MLKPQSLTSWLGIDIGLAGVKIAEVARHRKGPCWLSRAYHRFGQPLDSGSPQPARIAELLADELPPAADGLIRPAVVSLPTSWCISRIVRAEALDDLGPQMIKELGYDAQWCAWHLPQSGTGPRHLVAYGIRSDIAQQVGRLINAVGHRCVQIDSHPLALHRSTALTTIDTPPKGILDWGWESCVLVLSAESGPSLLRNLPNCGLRHLIRAAADRLGCQPPAVMQLLRQQVNPSASVEAGRRISDQSHDILSPYISRVADEIRQTVQYAARIGCDVRDGVMVVCGGTGCLPAVAPMLSNRTEMEVVPWQWAGEKKFSGSVWTPPDAMFATALSLAAGDNLP